MKIENDKLIIGDTVIGDEEYVLSEFKKAVKYDKVKKAIFIEGDA